MTPCEKLGYKVGDRFDVVAGGGSAGMKIGAIVVLTRDDETENPFFKVEGDEKDRYACGHVSSVCPLKTEAEKRGAKFGTIGVVKATGERVVFQKEASGIWHLLTEKSQLTLAYDPFAIRLDHEPEYKEIPFSEATDEQRMDVGNLMHGSGRKITQIVKFANGGWGYSIEGSKTPSTALFALTVRVPA